MGTGGSLHQLERTNRELVLREAHLRAILDAEPECVKVLDAEGQRGEMNRAGLAMLEVESLEEAQQTPLIDDLLPEHREAFAGLHQEVLLGGSGVLEFEILGRRGTRRWVETHATPLRNAEGLIEGLLGLTRDVTERRRAAAALEQSRARYAGLVQSIDGIVWEADATTLQFTFVSKRAVRILGYPVATWLTEHNFWPNHIHPEDRDHAVRSCLSSTRRGEDHVLEYRMVAADGGAVWVRDIVTYVEEPGGPAVLRGIMVDITARREAEAQVERHHRVRVLLSGINQSLVRNPTPQDLSDTACRIAVDAGGFLMAWIGRRSPETGRLERVADAGASADTLAIVDQLLRVERPEDGCVQTWRALTTGTVAVCNDIETDSQTSHWRAAALERGIRSMVSLPLTLDGEAVGTFNLYAADSGFFDSAELDLLEELARDISFGLEAHRLAERKREAENALRASEARFRELAETIQEVFWITDPGKSRILYVSPAYETVWGRPRETVYSRPLSWAEAVHPGDRDHVVEAIALRQSRGEYDEEYRIIRPTGEVRWIRERAYPVRGATGQVERIVGVARDITERKAAEEQLHHAQKMESVGQLAAGIAHDFNNALTVINGIAEMALADLPPGTVLRQDLAAIRDAGARAAELTRQMLAFSRKQILRPVAVNLNTLVAEVEVLLRRVLGGNIELTARLAPDLALAMVDPGQFHHVLMNLAVNSRDAMPRGGGGTVTIETSNVTVNDDSRLRFPSLSQGRHVALGFSDTGMGMDSNTLQHVFEPFFTTKEPGKGTGLGMATVHGIVTQSGGGVSVESEPGVGTTVRVFLPAAEGRDVERRAVLPAPIGAPGGESVLVVDDDTGVREVARRVLERAGYTVQTAASGREALERLNDSPDGVHLVLTAVVMPWMSGPELAEEIRRRDPPVRVLFTSGYADDTMLRHGVPPADLHLLHKPFSADALTTKVREILDS